MIEFMLLHQPAGAFCGCLSSAVALRANTYKMERRSFCEVGGVMADQHVVTLNDGDSARERIAALAVALDRAMAEANSLGLGVVAARISMARDQIELGTDLTPSSESD